MECVVCSKAATGNLFSNNMLVCSGPCCEKHLQAQREGFGKPPVYPKKPVLKPAPNPSIPPVIENIPGALAEAHSKGINFISGNTLSGSGAQAEAPKENLEPAAAAKVLKRPREYTASNQSIEPLFKIPSFADVHTPADVGTAVGTDVSTESHTTETDVEQSKSDPKSMDWSFF
jgi:hypothetical protein